MPWASVYELARCILHGEGTTKGGSQPPVSFYLVWLFFQPDRPHHVYVPGWRHFAPELFLHPMVEQALLIDAWSQDAKGPLSLSG